MESKIYNQHGKESGSITLPESIFGLPWNADLVHQVATSLESNKRTNVANSKGRGEVRGGGKKPWRQKGTGRARHGSSRSPIWVGGGVTHGPTNEKVYARKVNKGMKTKALRVVLSKKLKDGELLFVENFSLAEPKAKEARKILSSLAGVKGFESLTTKKKNALHLAVPRKDANFEKSFRNFGALSVGELRNVNISDLLRAKYFVMVDPAESLKLLENK